MHDNGIVDGLRGGEEADAHPGREDLREAVEPDHPANFGLIEFEREVRWGAGGVPEVQVVVRVVCGNRSICITRKAAL